MDTLDEFKNVSPLRSPSLASRQESTRSVKTPQQLSRSPTFRSGRTSPGLMPEMSVTEQIARKTRKSTVLDQKNALMILAIPDYDDYKIMHPYSCRSLSNKSKFVGGRDFITRHNPQEVNDFKMQYSRDVGNLNRHRSVLAPPNTLLQGMPPLSPSPSSKSFKFAASQTLSSVSGNQVCNDGNGFEVWKRVFTAGKKPCWILTEFGINQLIGPEYSINTRLPLTTARDEPSPLTSRSPLRPESPFAAYTARDSARIGLAVDLCDENSLGLLSRIATYSPASRPLSPPRSPYREPIASLSGAMEASPRMREPAQRRPSSFGLCSTLASDMERVSISPSLTSPQRAHDVFRHDPSSMQLLSPTSPTPTLLPFAMEVSPPRITLDNLAVGEVYLFPVRVRNVGTKQERYRVKHLSVSAGGSVATIAETAYDKDTARLAPGLAAIVTLTLSFSHRGHIAGQLRVDTEGVGACDVRIEGTVR